MQPTSRLPDDEFGFYAKPTMLPVGDSAESKWIQLSQLIPELRRVHRRSGNASRPPRAMADVFFLGLCAAFADPTKREILRALIVELLHEDIIDLLLEPEKE